MRRVERFGTIRFQNVQVWEVLGHLETSWENLEGLEYLWTVFGLFIDFLSEIRYLYIPFVQNIEKFWIGLQRENGQFKNFHLASFKIKSK